MERGNVLFLILIAVALFAALSYAVTSSTRSGGGNSNKEKAALAAAQVIQYGTTLENAILRMRISGGCTHQQISFENPISFAVGRIYDNPSAPVDFHCHVFKPQGGNVSFNQLNGIITSYNGQPPNEELGFSSIPMPNVGTTQPDLVFVVTGGLSRKVCSEINARLGVADNGNTLPEWSSDAMPEFQGTYNSSADFGLDPVLNHLSFCAYDREQDDLENNGGYFHVLIPR